MSLSGVNSISVGNTVNTPEVRKKRDADAKLAVGITLIVLGVLAAAAAVVLSFCFGMVLVPIIVGGVSLALGITGIVLAILSKENNKTDAPSSNDLDSNRLVVDNEPPPPASTVLPTSNGDPLPPPPRELLTTDSAGNDLHGDGSDSDGDPLPPPPSRVSAPVDRAGNELHGNDSDRDDEIPPELPPRRRDRGSPSQLFGSHSNAIKVSDDKDERSQYRQSIRRTIKQLKEERMAQSRSNHMNPRKSKTVTDVIDRMSYNSSEESSDEYTSGQSDGEWEDRSLLHDSTKRGMVHRVARAVVRGALRSVRGWNPFASAGE